MEIPVIIEPAYYGTFWCRQTLAGMRAEAAKKKYDLRLIRGESFERTDWEAVFLHSPRLVIVVGTSISWVPKALSFFSAIQAGVLLASFEPPDEMICRGVVRMNYVNAMHTILEYLRALGKERVALYAFNPNSSADQVKERYFTGLLQGRGIPAPERHCFRNTASLGACFRAFAPHIGAYDALICANDVTAVSAIRHLTAAGVRVPEDMFLVSFGDSMLARAMHPSITSVSLDHEKIGRQAVTLYVYLLKQPDDVSAALLIGCLLRVRESTMRKEATGNAPPALCFPNDVNFYNDPEAASILRMEGFLCALDELDLSILNALSADMPYEDIAQMLATTISTIKYRIRKMQSALDAQTREALMQKLMGLALHPKNLLQ